MAELERKDAIDEVDAVSVDDYTEPVGSWSRAGWSSRSRPSLRARATTCARCSQVEFSALRNTACSPASSRWSRSSLSRRRRFRRRVPRRWPPELSSVGIPTPSCSATDSSTIHSFEVWDCSVLGERFSWSRRRHCSRVSSTPACSTSSRSAREPRESALDDGAISSDSGVSEDFARPTSSRRPDREARKPRSAELDRLRRIDSNALGGPNVRTARLEDEAGPDLHRTRQGTASSEASRPVPLRRFPL